jgi:regulator of sirC expression with transglutaminase-like and TPR domain
VTTVNVTQRFVALVGGPGGVGPLDEATLLIAAHARRGLDVAAERCRLDELAAGVAAPTLDALRTHLFGELGYAGNQVDYYDPRNSYLDQVVKRRVGIPITLAVLMLEVGRRIGVPLAGVSMPGHFVVRDKVDRDVFVDPFARGAVVDRTAIEARFRASQPSDAAFDPAYLDPVPASAVIARMLANLDAIAAARSDRAMLEWVVRLRVAMPGAPASLHRRLSGVLAARGRFDAAADVLERLDALGTGALGTDASDVDGRPDDLALAHRLRARLN